jgi:GTP-binding protein Era
MDFVLENCQSIPAYYEKDALTDRNDRFFASEMISAQIFKQYKKEIPYSTEVIVTAFVEGEKLHRISAEIIVERDSQKNIIIGTKGEMLKIVGTYARRDMEDFFQKKDLPGNVCKGYPRLAQQKKLPEKIRVRIRK